MQQAKRLILYFRGIVQGVGFRPALYRWATHWGFKGSVQNQGDGVELILEGESRDLNHFLRDLETYFPEQAKVETIEQRWESCQDLKQFSILKSKTSFKKKISIPVDLATCLDCFAEFKDSSHRRYGYPFNACTNCGPRYTVLEEMPYDRKHTTLKVFPLCSSCEKEYRDPLNRRFHGENIVCSECGPQLDLSLPSQEKLLCTTMKEKQQVIYRYLKAGKILALRGLGGYLLVCSATHPQAIENLRVRKQRPCKPFAVMARTLEQIQRACELTSEEIACLSSEKAPIVLLTPRQDSPLSLNLIAPDSTVIGMMLPTSPLHLFLFGEEDPLKYKHEESAESKPFDYLIMTSGNQHGEPLCRTNEEAFEKLASLADLFITHNRELKRTCDDSLVRCTEWGTQILRRARGFSPERFRSSSFLAQGILALGAELKNTICLSFEEDFLLSPHIGDLFHFETFMLFQQYLKEFPSLMLSQTYPDVLVVDLHPHYHSTRWGQNWGAEENIRVIEVQHHHAHAVSVMFEYQKEEALALLFDGNGYGSDQTLWGGELFYATYTHFKRLGTFKPVPLPAGDRAIREPALQAFARLASDADEDLLQRLGISPAEAELLKQMIQQKINTFQTSAVGRFFDAVAALLGLIPGKISYEAQGAIRLEQLASRFQAQKAGSFSIYPYEVLRLGDRLEIQHHSTFFAIWQDVKAQRSLSEIAWLFHETLASMALDLACYGYEQTQIKTIVLSGGVFQNQILTRCVYKKLTQQGFNVYLPQHLPLNDGGISLGQAVIAKHLLRSEVSLA
jgi:hydrogenase maturation protein HypF